MSLSTMSIRGGDFLRWEANAQYNRSGKKLIQSTGASVTINQTAGIPVKADGANWTPILDADEASCEAFLITNSPVVLASGVASNELYSAIVRGPAVLDQSSIPALDIEGAAYDVAACVTAFLAGTDAYVKFV